MKRSSGFSRRHFIQTTGALMALGAPGAKAMASEEWPKRPVRLIVAFTAGGGVDTSTRIVANKLKDVLGVPIVIDNRPGGSTVVATQAVLNSQNDGYTFLVSSSITTYLSALFPSLPFDPLTDVIPVGPISMDQLVLVASTKSGITSFADMQAKVKADPQAYAFGSYGVGTDAHMLVEQLRKLWGVDLLHVPYNGSLPSIQAIVSGETSFTLGPLAVCEQFINTGVMVPLAVRGTPRSPFLPDVPTLDELGVPGYALPVWSGVFAGKNTPPQVLARMSQALMECARDEEVLARLSAARASLKPMNLEEFAQFAKDTAEVDGTMLREAGVQLGS